MNNEKIPLIHNYCDRWCERCTFTSRCAIYEDESDIPEEERDANNQAFWKKLEENFAKAREILQKAAAEAGFNLEPTSEELEEAEEREDAMRLQISQHPISVLTLEYAKVARAWLKTQPGMLDRLEDLKQELILGVESEQGAKQQTATIRESLSVIQWYLHFIHVKFTRALMSRMQDDYIEGREDYDYDSNGSAKIALIAIERSMQAWSELFSILPREEDHFLKVLSMLDNVKTRALNEFPEAMAFVRPGFDD